MINLNMIGYFYEEIAIRLYKWFKVGMLHIFDSSFLSLWSSFLEETKQSDAVCVSAVAVDPHLRSDVELKIVIELFSISGRHRPAVRHPEGSHERQFCRRVLSGSSPPYHGCYWVYGQSLGGKTLKIMSKFIYNLSSYEAKRLSRCNRQVKRSSIVQGIFLLV